MSAFYDRMEATARRLIEQFGYSAFILREGTPTGPPHDPQPGPDERHDCIIVETRYGLTDRDATLVQTGDKLGIISTDLAIVPADSDRIEIGGLEYHFADFRPLLPGGQTLLYKFIARR